MAHREQALSRELSATQFLLKDYPIETDLATINERYNGFYRVNDIAFQVTAAENTEYYLICWNSRISLLHSAIKFYGGIAGSAEEHGRTFFYLGEDDILISDDPNSTLESALELKQVDVPNKAFVSSSPNLENDIEQSKTMPTIKESNFENSTPRRKVMLPSIIYVPRALVPFCFSKAHGVSPLEAYELFKQMFELPGLTNIRQLEPLKEWISANCLAEGNDEANPLDLQAWKVHHNPSTNLQSVMMDRKDHYVSNTYTKFGNTKLKSIDLDLGENPFKKSTLRPKRRGMMRSLILKDGFQSESSLSDDDIDNMSRAGFSTIGDEHISEAEKIGSLSEDSFSFLVSAPVCSTPFITGAVVLTLKCSIFVLLVINLIDFSPNSRNPFNIPASNTITVLICQLLALIIAIVTQNDISTALVKRHDGHRESAIGMAFVGASKSKYYGSTVLQFIAGILGLLSTFLLIVQSSDIVELLLNFTAVRIPYL